jgi:DNA-directed RNA polymerase subunit RPC12/RpoP
MSRLYICDNCDKEFDSLTKENGETCNLFRIAISPVYPNQKLSYWPVIREVCFDCKGKIVKAIKAGVN